MGLIKIKVEVDNLEELGELLGKLQVNEDIESCEVVEMQEPGLTGHLEN